MYNNPYIYQSAMKPNLFSKLFSGIGAGSSVGTMSRGINWGNLLNNTQKSLGIINQAIPIVHQVKPIVTNAKTMFKLAGAIKSESTTKKNNTKNSINTINTKKDNHDINKPIFYI